MNSIFPMEIEYFFYKIFDAIDKNVFEKPHASVAKELRLDFSYFQPCTTFLVYTVGKSVLFRTKYEIFKKFYRIAAEKIVI